MNFGFIIPTCINNKIHFNQLKRCVESIRKFHETIHIMLIDDSESEYTNQIIQYFRLDNKIYIKNSSLKGSADQQIFKVMLETELFEKAIFIQDSMILNKKIEGIDKINLQFIWHFTNHRAHWDVINEPKTKYNIQHNITTHTELIRHNVMRDYNNNEVFQKFVLKMLINKHLWCGCFGSLCIIDKKTLLFLNEDISFVENFVNASSNRDRRVNETIFSLICHFKFPMKNFETSYDELYYDGQTHGGHNELIGCNTGFDNLKWCAVHGYFSKISFNR